jgi:tyrosine-protein phosphatase non-receptor type 23
VNDPEVSGPDIFARLVPMKAHEASSLYRWDVQRLLRLQRYWILGYDGV